MKVKKILLVISIIIFYCIISYNVFVGLIYGTALQGFSGLCMIVICLVAVILAISNILKN